jgi:hypothetical protein
MAVLNFITWETGDTRECFSTTGSFATQLNGSTYTGLATPGGSPAYFTVGGLTSAGRPTTLNTNILALEFAWRFLTAPTAPVPVVELLDTAGTAVGSIWIDPSGYQVFKGLPAELQAEVEANGRAAGTRVRVELARPVYVSLSGVVLALPGYDLAELITNIKTAIVLYGATIEPGAPLYFHRLHAYLRRAVPGIDNIRFDQTDKQPGDPPNRIAFLPGLMTFR